MTDQERHEVRESTIRECAALCEPYVQMNGAAGGCQGAILLLLGEEWDADAQKYVKKTPRSA